MNTRRTPVTVPVERATCSRCGDESCAWLKSKGGKSYLVRAFVVREHGEPSFVASKSDFHRCAAGTP